MCFSFITCSLRIHAPTLAVLLVRSAAARNCVHDLRGETCLLTFGWLSVVTQLIKKKRKKKSMLLILIILISYFPFLLCGCDRLRIWNTSWKYNAPSSENVRLLIVSNSKYHPLTHVAEEPLNAASQHLISQTTKCYRFSSISPLSLIMHIFPASPRETRAI